MPFIVVEAHRSLEQQTAGGHRGILQRTSTMNRAVNPSPSQAGVEHLRRPVNAGVVYGHSRSAKTDGIGVRTAFSGSENRAKRNAGDVVRHENHRAWCVTAFQLLKLWMETHSNLLVGLR